jgi:hypothetical protein
VVLLGNLEIYKEAIFQIRKNKEASILEANDFDYSLMDEIIPHNERLRRSHYFRLFV